MTYADGNEVTTEVGTTTGDDHVDGIVIYVGTVT
jgi:L-asparaginase/Glu-tRNA(Gln) amidotransferase subunit D